MVVKLEVAEYNYIVPTLEYVHEYSYPTLVFKVIELNTYMYLL